MVIRRVLKVYRYVCEVVVENERQLCTAARGDVGVKEGRWWEVFGYNKEKPGWAALTFAKASTLLDDARATARMQNWSPQYSIAPDGG